MPIMPIIQTPSQRNGATRKVIAVDFDGTLCESRYPEIGEPRDDVIQNLKRCQAEGAALILWTCREGALLRNAERWCAARGLIFDAVNDNLPERVKQYKSNPRKISADEYWDDRAVRPQTSRQERWRR